MFAKCKIKNGGIYVSLLQCYISTMLERSVRIISEIHSANIMESGSIDLEKKTTLA